MGSRVTAEATRRDGSLGEEGAFRKPPPRPFESDSLHSRKDSRTGDPVKKPRPDYIVRTETVDESPRNPGHCTSTTHNFGRGVPPEPEPWHPLSDQPWAEGIRTRTLVGVLVWREAE